MKDIQSRGAMSKVFKEVEYLGRFIIDSGKMNLTTLCD
jgi:hypothetical protein